VVELVDEYCVPLKAQGVDTVILGCTHYPLVRPIIQRSLGRGAKLVSSGEAIAEDLSARLAAAGLANDDDRRGSYRFLCSGDTGSFAKLATRFLQLPLGEVAQVDVATAVRAPGAVRAASEVTA
jgi:glutamate racemase